MPLSLRFSPDEKCEVAVWKVEESPEELLDSLKSLGIYAEIPFFRNPSRLSDWLTARLLLAEMGIHQRIRYDDAGKPHLHGDGSAQISLSHSSGFVAAICHKSKSSGIDIEKNGDRILKVKHKFVGTESAWVRPDDPGYTERLYKIWGAKECAFKIYGRGGVDFRGQLFVDEPSEGTPESSWVTLEKDGKSCRYRVFFQYLDKMILTYGYET